MIRKTIYLALSATLTLAGCGQQAEQRNDLPAGQTMTAVDIQEKLLDAQPGDTITLPEGFYKLDRSLSLTVDGVTLKGAGMDKTILSFKEQLAGAEGLLVTANDFTIEDMALEDTKGDALKVNEGKNIVIRRLRTEWTDGHKTSNGAYGIYPVQTTNVLIEESIAIGASDAGIYVGQSKNVIIRNNRAEYNVAGIEIENTIGADVYDNVATNNTGGILVFNMPNLSQPGHGTRVYQNSVFENNTKNFGHKGTPVASVPAGSGIVVNSNDQVEIFENNIKNNKTANIIISSVYSAGYNDGEAKADFDPYPESIFIYDNTLEGGGNSPDGLDLKALKTAMFGLKGSFPDILWDGYYNEDLLVDGVMPEDQKICIQNGEAGILNVDGPNGYKNPTTDIAPHKCTLKKLPAIVLEF